MKKISYLLISGYTLLICAIYPSAGEASALLRAISCTTSTAAAHGTQLINSRYSRGSGRDDADDARGKIEFCLAADDPKSITNYYCTLKRRLRNHERLNNNYRRSDIDCGQGR